jgi:hypothetical protein
LHAGHLSGKLAVCSVHFLILVSEDM